MGNCGVSGLQLLKFSTSSTSNSNTKIFPQEFFEHELDPSGLFVRNIVQTSSIIIDVKQNNYDALLLKLADKSCDINEKGMWSNTPLILSCQNGNSKIALLLIEHGADKLLLNDRGVSALHYACLEGLIDVVAKFPIDAIDIAAPLYNPHEDKTWILTPLCAAIIGGHTQVCQLLLTDSSNTFPASFSTITDPINQCVPVYHCAVISNSEDIMKLLISSKPELALTIFNNPSHEYNSYNILHLSCHLKRAALIKIMLSSLSVDAITSLLKMKNHLNMTPLQMICQSGNIGIFDIIAQFVLVTPNVSLRSFLIQSHDDDDDSNCLLTSITQRHPDLTSRILLHVMEGDIDIINIKSGHSARSLIKSIQVTEVTCLFFNKLLDDFDTSHTVDYNIISPRPPSASNANDSQEEPLKTRRSFFHRQVAFRTTNPIEAVESISLSH